MFEVPESARQEIKFVTNHYNYHEIILWIRMNEHNFVNAYQDRWINSIYFDTYDYHSYVANLSGQSARTKLRYRWYGKKKYPSAGQLEVKIKRNFFGWKKTFPVANDPYKEGDNWRKVIKNIACQLPGDVAHMLRSYNFPVIINRYKRSYYVSSDKKIRITVDRSQTVYDQRHKAFPELDRESNLPDTVVTEIKFDRNDSRIANKIMQGFPVRVSRHSKYMNAVDSVSGNRLQYKSR